MGETDVTFRRLLRGLPGPILRLAFPRRRLEPLGTLDPSVDRTRQLTADSLFRVRNGKTETAVHVEIEREWRATIPLRLFDYASAAVTATRLPVSSIVVLLRPGGRPPRGTWVYRSRISEAMRSCSTITWYRCGGSTRGGCVRSSGFKGTPSCVAMRGADEAFVRSLADEVRTDRSLATRDRQSTMQLLYVVSAAILGVETARRAFHVESIIQDPNVQELIREWEDKGRVEGRAEGRVEGRAEGQVEGRGVEARLLLHTVLAARSFPVTEDVRARIDGEPDVARLESWLEAAVTAPAIGDVFRDG